MTKEEVIGKLKDAILEGDEEAAQNLANELLEAGMKPLEIINASITAALDQVGEAFEIGNTYLPELILAGDAARAALDVIIPRMSAEDRDEAVKGTVVIGTIFGDAHDIGKNIVIALLAAYGIKIVDLGINVPVKQYIEAAIKERADIIAISSLIATSLPYQREVINTLKDRGLREDFYVIVGGGPVTPEWTEAIGADGYGRDAKDATVLCQHIFEALSQGGRPPMDKPILVGALKHG